MASWLKVAEDLFEVVDRRAKIVATELTDEQSSSQPSGSSGQEGQAKKGKPREKGPMKLTTGDAGNRASAQKEKKSRQPPRERIKIEKIRPSPPADSSNVDATASEPDLASIDAKGANDKGTADKGEKAAVDLKNDRGVNVVDTSVEVQSMEKSSEDAGPVPDGVAGSGNSDSTAESFAPSVPNERSEPSSSNQTTEIGPAVSLHEKDTAVAVIQERNISDVPDTQGSGKSQESKKDNLSDSPESTENQQEHKSDSVSVKDQDQLEEAQGLLKSAVKTGQSKEARLARVCAGLSSRLQEYKSENAQLEELLVQELSLWMTKEHTHCLPLSRFLIPWKGSILYHATRLFYLQTCYADLLSRLSFASSSSALLHPLTYILCLSGLIVFLATCSDATASRI